MEDKLAQLRTQLAAAIAAHYEKLTAEVSDIYGYSLFSDDDVSNLAPVANRESAIKSVPDDDMYNYYRYLAVEWSEWDDFGLFENVNQTLHEIHADDRASFNEKREPVLQVCLEVMQELEAKGVFGPRTDERFVVICLSDSDDEIMMESAELLNTSKAFAAYSAEF